MRSNRLKSVVLVALSWLAVGGCDPVRSGDFRADSPPDVWIDLPTELTDVARDAAERGEFSAWIDEGFLQLRSTRQWYSSSATPRLVSSFGLFTSPLWVPLWDDLVSALDQESWSSRFSTTDLGMTDADLMTDPPRSGPVTAVATVKVVVVPKWPGPVLLYGAVDDVMVASVGGTDMQPLGPAGPTLSIPAGFHRYRRTCTSVGQQSFTEVPIDAPVELVRIGWVDMGPEPYLMPQGTVDYGVARCNIDVGATIDLGSTVVPLHEKQGVDGGRIHVESMAWTPGSDGLYLLDGWSAVYHLALNDLSTRLIASGGFKGPITVAMDGTSLLYWTQGDGFLHYARQSLVDSMLPLQTALPSAELHPTDPPGTVLSPDGYLLAHGHGIMFMNLRTSTRIVLNPTGTHDEIPLAWAPTGDAILVERVPVPRPDEAATDRQFEIVDLTLSAGVPSGIRATTPLPAEAIPELLKSTKKSTNGASRDGRVRYFWSASGPQALIQDKDGVRVYNFATQNTVSMIPPTHVAPPIASTAAVVATDQVFAWDTQCFGLGETACHAELRRMSLASGTIDTVARADQPWMFAVSPDGTQVASYRDGDLYLKTIAQ